MPHDPLDSARRARAERRRQTWTGRLVSPHDDLPPVGATALERLALVTELSARAWSLSGEPVPTYTRGEMPGRVIREGEPR
jgi:hypothetical protein